ncbi:MAG: AAA family ATPase [Polyangiaceae bacterium]
MTPARSRPVVSAIDQRVAGKAPQVDLTAEALTVVFALEARGAIDLIEEHVRGPEDFASPLCSAVWRRVVAMRERGQPITAASVASELAAHGDFVTAEAARKEIVGLVDGTPTTHPSAIAEHARRVADLAAVRRFQALAKRADAEGYSAVGDVTAWLDGIRAELVQIMPPAPHRALAIEADDIFAPLPPVPWLVPELDIAPGAPTLIAGYGFSRKTLGAQDLALSVAAGGQVWGAFRCSRRGRVVHVDYEQGRRLTSERYQRLAHARGIHPDELRGQLALVALPDVTLTSPQGLDWFSRVCEGAALVIVDSLRAAAPDIEENSSDIRRPLDMLTRLSERTGVVPLVIHHARKPSRESAGGPRMAIRGSGAIYDACSTILVFGAEKGEPTLVSHEKARNRGILTDDFRLATEDTDGGLGLRLRHIGIAPASEAPRETIKRGAVEEAVLGSLMRSHPRSLRSLRSDVEGRDCEIDEAIERLIARGLIREEPGPRGARHFMPVFGGGAT